jgi:hypothetical protein
MDLAVVVLGLAAGLSIGVAGVGGVIQVPILVYVLGYPLPTAIASSSFSFLFVSAAGTTAYNRRGSIPWPMTGWIAVGLAPSAALGAWVNSRIPESVPTVALAAILLGSGIDALRTRNRTETHRRLPSRAQLVTIGSIVGLGSALTGTGGPVLLVPLLLWRHVPALLAVGSSQAAQIPIALAATAAYFAFGTIDVSLGTTLGIAQVAGVTIGARLAHRAPASTLRAIIGIALTAAGVLVGGRALL